MYQPIFKSSMMLTLFLAFLFMIIHTAHAEQNNKKIAFLFLTRGPMPLEDIWREFFHWRADPSEYNIYVNTLPGFEYSNDSFFHGKIIRNPVKVDWGQMNQVRATKALVRQALEDPLNERFCLMTETCIPLVPFQKWKTVMFSHNVSITNACVMEGMNVEDRWITDLEAIGLKQSDWRKSADYFALIRKHAEIYAGNIDTEYAWQKVGIAVEHYLPTTLAHLGLENETTCTDGFAHINWKSGHTTQTLLHPFMYEAEHINRELFKTLQHAVNEGHENNRNFSVTCSGFPELCHFTARKFSAGAKMSLLQNMQYILSDENQEYTDNPWRNYKSKYRVYKQVDPVTGKVEVQYFLIDGVNNAIRRIPDNETAHEYFHMMHFHLHSQYAGDSSFIQNMAEASPVELQNSKINTPLLSRKDLSLYREASKREVWCILHGHRRSVPNMDTFNSWHLDLDNVHVVTPDELYSIPLGPPLEHKSG